jgi:hypothetical protein
MDWTAVAALTVLVKKVVDLLRYLNAREMNGVVTQLVVWAAAVGAVMLAAHTAWASTSLVSGVALSQMNVWSQVYLGLTVGSASSLVQDAVKAVDSSDSARIPPLVTRSAKK